MGGSTGRGNDGAGRGGNAHGDCLPGAAPAGGCAMRSAPLNPGAASPAAFKGKVVPAALSTMRILRYLAEQPQPASLTQVARAMKLVPSTCFHILQTLARENFVAFDPVRKDYAIGFGVMELAKGAAVIGRDVHQVRPILERVAEDHDVTVTLWRPITREQLMLVMSAFGRGAVRIHMSVGQRVPMLSAAAGRLMAAHLQFTPKELRALFRQVNWARPLSFDKFMAQAAEARKKGWAADKGLFITGTAAVAVPVFDTDGQVVMAAAATLLVDRYDEAQGARLAAALSAASRAITQVGPTL